MHTYKHAGRYLGRVARSIVTSTVLILGISNILPVVATAHADDAMSAALSQPVGTVVQQSTMTLPSQLQSLATGVRALYVSTDLNGNKIIVSGAFITPNVRPVHPNVVAWAHPTTGVGDNCAPSLNLSVFWPDAADQVAAYLQQGWTVAATDYQGLSTDGTHQYLIGSTEARSVIDSVRAARNLDHSLTANWVASGQSQGGQASLFAGELSSTYGGGLNLAGVVSLSPASHEEQLVPAILTSQGKGYLVMALVGLAAADPSVSVNTILAQPAIDLLPVLDSGCFNEIFSAYHNLTPSQTVVGGTVPAAIVNELAQLGDPGQQAPNAPVLLVQGTADTTVPKSLTADQQRIECSYGGAVDMELFPGATHDNISTVSTGLVSSYINDRFNGVTPPSNC